MVLQGSYLCLQATSCPQPPPILPAPLEKVPGYRGQEAPLWTAWPEPEVFRAYECVTSPYSN